MRSLRLTSLLLVLVAGMACDELDFDTPLAKLIVVFVDVSGTSSNDDWDHYADTYAKLVNGENGLAPGDRVILATISSTTLTEFTPAADLELPYSGVTLNDAEGAELARVRLMKAFEGLRKTPPSARTHVIDASQVAAQIFRNDTGRQIRRLVVLSDMMEESYDGNFRLRPPSDDDAGALIEQLKAAGRIPVLEGVRVYVIGARSRSPQAMAQIERFWRRYFEIAGAELRPGDYSTAAALVSLDDGF